MRYTLLDRHLKMPLTDMDRLEAEANEILRGYYHGLRDFFGEEAVEELRGLSVRLTHEGFGHVAIRPVIIDQRGAIVATIQLDASEWP